MAAGFRGGRPAEGGVEEALALSVLDAESLLSGLTKVSGIRVSRPAQNLPLLSMAGRWQDPDFSLDWLPEDSH